MKFETFKALASEVRARTAGMLHTVPIIDCHPGVIFRAILVHMFSPIVGQACSPIVGHPCSPKLGHEDASEIPPLQAYFQLSDRREMEEACLERGKTPWTFERS